MAITVTTNMASLKTQNALTNATNAMNKASERMSSGYKINAAKDDAAGMAVSTKMETQISGAKVAIQNAQLGDSMLTTTEGSYDVIASNLSRIRDLTEQAANGVYDDDSRSAIESEVTARAAEIDRISKTAEFNGMKLLDGTTQDVKLQVGTYGTENDTIAVDNSVFNKATVTALGMTTAIGTAFADATSARAFLSQVDSAIDEVTTRKSAIGASQNRLESAVETLTVQKTNLSSANSQIKDADIAEESSNYVQQSILQQSAASLLVQANNAPQLALSLV